MRELRAIDFVHGLIEEGGQPVGGLERVFLHRIDGTDLLDDYAASWLAEGYGEVGVRCTLDLKQAYQ